MRAGRHTAGAGIAIALSFALAGCGLPEFGSGPAPDLYTLSPKSTFAAELPRKDGSASSARLKKLVPNTRRVSRA